MNDGTSQLRALLRERSVFWGDYTLSSGAKSNHYLDCKLTTFHPPGAVLVGNVVLDLIEAEAGLRGTTVSGVGGLTMGADPIALAVGIASLARRPDNPLDVFSVRRTAKTHGQHKLIEGNLQPGTRVAVIDDVLTRGNSTLQAIEAVERFGAEVAFIAALVDRQEGGRETLERKGYGVVSVFTQQDLLKAHASNV